MESVLERLPSGARVCVVRLRSLGDSVLTTPALALLKRQRPDLKIAVVSEERFFPIFEGNPDVDELLPPSLRAVRKWRSNLCLNFHGGAHSACMTLLSGAQFRAGFLHHRWSSLYNVPIPTAQEVLNVNRKVHTAEHLASAMFFLGVNVQEIPRARLAAERPACSARYAVLHPFASAPGKTWPAERFAQVARALVERHGLEPVFIAGPSDDPSPFSAWRTIRNAPLSQIKQLLFGASLFIGNDSGPAHMAAAFSVPVIVLFGSSDPIVWAPWKTKSVVLTSENGIEGISAGETLAVIDRLRERVRV
ncbi:MAG TPA: glycosyltransferase family 9 protein [Bryobacteraceae bacterium]|nr:glycosyltransferase family 9 protein [Bryobacteraceae bacterium]